MVNFAACKSSVARAVAPTDAVEKAEFRHVHPADAMVLAMMRTFRMIEFPGKSKRFLLL